MRLTKYARYRHKRCLDIDLVITKIKSIGRDYAELEVLYVLQRNPEMILDMGTVKINSSEYKNWKEV